MRSTIKKWITVKTVDKIHEYPNYEQFTMISNVVISHC